jgi:signal transduction histidine kinase
LACLAAGLAQLPIARQPDPLFPFFADVLVVVFHVCMAEGAIVALRPARDPRLAIEIALDGLLVLLSAAVLVANLQLDPAMVAGWLSPAEATLLLLTQIAVVGSLLFYALLMLWRDSELGNPVIDMLFVAALLFSFGDALGGFRLDAPPAGARWIFDAMRFTAWAVLAAAAVAARHHPGPTVATSRRSSVARRIRLMVIPAAVLFLAAWALGGSGEVPRTGLGRVAVAVLGFVLAVRVGVALFAVEREARERHAAEERAHRARMRAVTAQMNPHFLFNALHSLAALLRRDAAAAEGVLERLGDLLRYGIERGETAVSLADEWDFTRAYLDLERVRLGSRLVVDVSLDPDALARAVPPFILQPLVENAIRHAVDPSPVGGRISVRAAVHDDALVVEVGDSGPGADEQALWDSSGVGLRGVRTQLAAHFGEDARVEAVRSPSGFVVRLVLPRLDD